MDCSIVESVHSLCCLRGGLTAVFWSLHSLCCCLRVGLTAVFWILHSLCCCFKRGLRYCGVCSLSVLLFQAWIDCSSLHLLCCCFKHGLQYCGVCSLSVLFKGWIDCSILESSLSVLLFQAWIAILWSLFTLCVAVSGVDWLQYSGVSSPPSPWIV